MSRFYLLFSFIAIFLLGAILSFPRRGAESAESSNRRPKPEKATSDDQFAEDREPVEIKEIPFDGKRAMDYLETLCKIGPRISASAGMEKQQKILQKHFESFDATVSYQKFEGKQASQRKAVPMANMIISWNPKAKKRILLCGHYDTRPIADEEANRSDWTKPFLSANDGTSTAAFFMELANHMKKLPLKVGVDFVLFDAEEFIFQKNVDRFFIGSEYFAQQYEKHPPEYNYAAGILLDLFAGKNAVFPIEGNSAFYAGDLVESIWKEAKDQKVKAFQFQEGQSILDDHVALNKAGIPTIDILDFSYPHWHKLSDRPSNCSGESMTQVAKVITAWLQRQK